METIIQLLTDPENQPHQYVGDPEGLRGLISTCVLAHPDKVDAIEGDVRTALDLLEQSIDKGIVIERGSVIHRKVIDVLAKSYENAARTEAPASNDGEKDE